MQVYQTQEVRVWHPISDGFAAVFYWKILAYKILKPQREGSTEGEPEERLAGAMFRLRLTLTDGDGLNNA